MNLELSHEEINRLADALAKKLAAAQQPQAAPKPGDDLTDWVRGADLNKYIKMSKSTLLEYRERGLIGTAKLGGCLYYYLPDIAKLLKSLYKTPEYIRELEANCRAELQKSK